MMQEKIGIIGFGNMGSSIACALCKKYSVYIFDTDSKKTAKIKGLTVVKNITGLADSVGVVILAVKPQDFSLVLKQIKKSVKNKLVISIAAGITTGYLQKRLGKIAVVRIMPNLMAKIGKAVVCISKGRFASKNDLNLSRRLFGNLGKTLILDERLMNQATAISGSGPGYFFELIKDKSSRQINKYCKEIFMPSLEDAAISLGFKRHVARFLAQETAKNSVIFLKRTGLSAADLKKQVASKGGTTEAGLKILERGGSLVQAAQAAFKRAEVLTKSR